MLAASPAQSPSQWIGARLRRFSIVVLVALCATFGPVLLLHLHRPAPGGQFESHTGNPIGADFLAFHTAGSFAATGDAPHAYDPVAFTARIDGSTSAPTPSLPWAYPPPVFALTAPFGMLGPWPGFVLWTLTMAGLAVLGCALAARSIRKGAVALAFPGVQLVLACGQISALALALLGGAVRWWSAKPFLAGLCVGLMCFKPQLAIGPLALLALDRNRISAGLGAATGAAALVVLSAPFGIDAWRGFFSVLGPHSQYVVNGEIPLPRVATVYGFLRTLGTPHAPALAAHLATAVTGLAFTARLIRAPDAPEWSRALAVSGAALLVSPYLVDYDFALLALAFTPLIVGLGPKPDAWCGERLWFAFALALAPSLGMFIAKTAGLSIAGPILFAALCACAWRVRAAPERSPPMPQNRYEAVTPT